MGSKKPCPGCGQVDPYRKIDEVCRDCKRNLREVAWLRKALEEANAGRLVAKLGAKSHWNRYFTVRYPRRGNYEIGSALQRAIYHTCLAGSVPSGSDRDSPYLMKKEREHFATDGSHIYRAVTQEFFDAVQVLMDTIDEALSQSFAAGQEDGQRFLLDLAEGNVSINKYEDRLVKQEGQE